LRELTRESKLEITKMKNKMEYGDIDTMMEGLKLCSLIWEL
jgi:hypothetical protein